MRSLIRPQARSPTTGQPAKSCWIRGSSVPFASGGGATCGPAQRGSGMSGSAVKRNGSNKSLRSRLIARIGAVRGVSQSSVNEHHVLRCHLLKASSPGLFDWLMPTVERCPSQTTHVSLPICRYSRFWIRCCWIRMRSVSVNVGFVMTAAELISLSTSFRSLGPNRSPLQAGNLRETSCGPESPERCRDQHGLRACGRHSTTAARRALHRCSTRKPLAFPSVPDPGSIDAVVAALVEQSFVFGVKQHRRQHAVFLAMVVLPLILVRIRDMFLAPFVIDTRALAELHEPVAAIPRPEVFDIFRQILIAADEI